MKITFNSIFLLSICLLAFLGCKKDDDIEPVKQDLNLTSYDAIATKLKVSNGIMMNGTIDTATLSNVTIVSSQDFEATFPGGDITVSVAYSFADTLDRYRLEIIGSSIHWDAAVQSTTTKDTVNTGSFVFETPGNLAPGILKFRYQFYKNDSVKTQAFDSEVEILKFPVSGDQIKI